MRITYRFIFLTKGMVTRVSHADFDHAAQFRWSAHQGGGRRRTWYASRMEGRKHRIYLHRWLVAWGDAKVKAVDHHDGDGLNNTRPNLRPTSSAHNARNHPVRITSTTGFKGVDVDKRSGKYRARITDKQSKRVQLGLFETPEAAARAYDRAAYRYFGTFARFNFPSEVGPCAIAATTTPTVPGFISSPMLSRKPTTRTPSSATA